MSELNSQASADDQRHRELLTQSAQGSREAFSELYRLLYPPLVRFVYRYTPSTALIEEIVNDTLLVVWQKAGSFRGESRAMTWVLGIASRRAMKSVAREQVRAEYREAYCAPTVRGDTTGKLITQQALDWAMAQLNMHQRLAVELAYFHGLSCEEMAEVMDCPLSTAKTRLHYGRQYLRGIFASTDQALEFSDLMEEVSQ